MTPQNEEELASFLAEAQNPVCIEGAGTRGITQGRVNAEETISTSSLSGISLYEPGALTIVAKAGTSVAEIEATLEAEGQELPFEPMDHRTVLGTDGAPTIGGVVSGNISGPRRIQAGACRDSLIGVRFIDGAGNIIKNGGRVMKNVTGYDLVKLMAGSYGTLGVLTEVSFKVLPKSETSATLVLHGLDDTAAVAACCDALGSPFNVTGAAHIKDEEGAKTYLRIEGFEQSVAYRTEQMKTLFKEHSVSVETKSDPIWNSIRDVTHFENHDGDLWKLSVKPTDGPVIVKRLLDQNIDLKASYDWGGGLVWMAVPRGTDIRAKIGTFDGHATLVKGQGAPMLHPQNAVVKMLEEGLRNKFDPKGILNPGVAH